MENPFSLKEKTTGQTLNNFTIIKSITIILVYFSRLQKKLLFFLYSHTHYSKAATLCSLLSIFLLHAQFSVLAVFFFSKQLPLGCAFFSLIWFLLSLFSILYAAHPCCCSHQFLWCTLVLAFISKSIAPYESQEHMDS